MAIININFDKKSIQSAIKQVKEIQTKMQKEVPNVFVNKCLVWVKNKANEYLSSLPMESLITSDIMARWEITITNGIGRLVNTSDKAVYVEFGVGKVAQGNPHPNASLEGYEYNIQNGKKDYKNRWRFMVDENEGIDLLMDYYEEEPRKDKLLITTSGSPANLYLYNSAMDLISTSVYKTLWQETLKQTI